MFEDENYNLEIELQRHAGSLLTNRLAPLKAEFERLQATFAEVNARLLEQVQSTATQEETSGLTAQVQQWLEAAAAKAEQNFQERLRTELEKNREEISASLQQQFEADFQTRLEQSNLAIRHEAEAEIEQLRGQIVTLTTNQSFTQATAPPAAPLNYNLLKSAIEAIDAQRTQSETLTTLLHHAAQFSPRVAFYVVRSGDAVGWKTVGFDNGLNDETVRSLAVSIQAPSLLGEALGTQHTAVALNPSQAEIAPVLGRFSHPVPQGVVAVPLVVRGKAAAVLYADSGTASDDTVQLDALETLVHIASMAIELLPVRRNAPESARLAQPATPTPVPVNTESAEATYQTEASIQSASAQAETTGSPAALDQSSAVPSTTPDQITAEADPFTYVADPTTDRLAQSDEGRTYQSDLAQGPSEDDITQASAIEPMPDASAQTAAAYSEALGSIQPEFGSGESAEPASVAPSAAVTQEVEEERASIFDRLRTEAAVPILPNQNPGMSLGGYIPPDSLGNNTNSDVGTPKSDTSLPEWMQRLQEEQVAPVSMPPASTPQPASPWASVEEAFNTVPPIPPPAPPSPPPLRVTSVPEYSQPSTDAADTERLPTPSPAIPFQMDAPSVRVVEERRDLFNAPSEPPRYAAPSLSVSNAATETEVRAHNDARRFARLLVSEIKLYNAAKVNEGRRQSDLYDRLKDEIDRSRKVYDKRVSPAVAAKFDYFYDELVQTLAEGDSSKLGVNCPGPVVITP